MAIQMNIDLALLQIEQYEHDLAAHQDILNALVPVRLTHFTLHFAKYQAGMLRARRLDDGVGLTRLITDSTVIVLAAANALSVNLQERAPEAARDRLSVARDGSFSSLLEEYCELVGDMAKACEVQDHGENYPHRQVLEESVARLALVTLDMARLQSMDLVASIRTRWRAVEDKQLIGKLRSSLAATKRKLSAVA